MINIKFAADDIFKLCFFFKISNKAWCLMWMDSHEISSLISPQIKKDITIFVICCSPYWCFTTLYHWGSDFSWFFVVCSFIFNIYLKYHQSVNSLDPDHAGCFVNCLQMLSADDTGREIINSINLLVSSTDNFCKQFGPRSGLTKCWALSGSKLFDTERIFRKKLQQTPKKHGK